MQRTVLRAAADAERPFSSMKVSPELLAARRAAAASVRYFAPGRARQRHMERWVAREFLRNVGVRFSKSQVRSTELDPPDVAFEGARFEVKELLDPGRRRHDDYKRRNERARNAKSLDELVDRVAPQRISWADLMGRVQAVINKASAKYGQHASDLDLLIYVNLRNAWQILNMPKEGSFLIPATYFRSVALLKDAAGCVLDAKDTAPIFLRARLGKWLVREATG